MSGPPAANEIERPTLLPVRIAGPTVDLAHLNEADYRAESFLDARLFGGGRTVVRRPWQVVSDAAPKPRLTHFIFHVGHCGSTLLSRLMGEHPGVFSVREPALLRDVALGDLPAGALDVLLALYGRVWRPSQTALIKATSFVSELGPALMARARGRAVLLGVTPPAYLRGILAGDNSRWEAKLLANTRKTRLERRLGRPLEARREGEVIAMAWLCETSALQTLADAYPQACLRLDFDRVLADPAGGLYAAFRHLRVDPLAIDLAGLAAGPLMGRYAKGPEHPYDATLRAAMLAEAAHNEADEVRAGMDWLQRQAESDPRVARVLTIAADVARMPFAAPGGGG